MKATKVGSGQKERAALVGDSLTEVNLGNNVAVGCKTLG